MKITKSQLKQIIKEEIEATLSEKSAGPDIDMAKVEDLAATFEQSPVIMDAVEKAMADPKVQAALEKLSSEGGLNEDSWWPSGNLPSKKDAYMKAYGKRADRARAAKVALGGGTIGAGGVATIMPAALMLLAPSLAVSPAIVALGLTAGPALFAIGTIITDKFGQMETSNITKARDPRAREKTDFNYWDHQKMRDQNKKS